MASLGRWNAVDPLADSPNNDYMTPYHYVANNPIRNIDPDGIDWYSNNETGEVHWQKGSNDLNGHINIGAEYTIFGDKHTIVHNQNEVVSVTENSPDVIENVDSSPPVDLMTAALATSAVLVADDATVVGVVDDIAIPFILIAGAIGSYV